MRIAHVLWSLNVGGIETMVADIARRQSGTCQVLLLVINDRYDESVLSSLPRSVAVELIRRPAGSWDPRHWLRLNRALARFGPDIIHAHQESIVRVLVLQSARKVLTVHATDTRATAAIRRYDQVFSISRAVSADLQKRSPPCTSRIVSNGIDSSAIQLKGSWRPTPLRIVQIGRLAHEEKGQDVLLHAVKQVRDSGRVPEVSVDFIGNGASLPYLQSLAATLGIERHCQFIPAQPRARIYSSLHSYDLLVQPSRYEGFGLTVAEALAARVPVLVADIEGPMEVINGGEHGWHFRAGDADDCARSIERIADEMRAAGFASRLDRARDHVARTYDLGATADNYIAEYRRVLD